MIGVLIFNFQIGNIDTKKNYSAAQYHYSLDWHPCNTLCIALCIAYAAGACTCKYISRSCKCGKNPNYISGEWMVNLDLICT